MVKVDFLLLALATIINAIASILIKKGANALVGGAKFGHESLLRIIAPAVNIYTISGLVLLGLSFIVFIFVVSRVNISIAQPILALAYVFTAIAAYFVFGEKLILSQIIGIGVILIGVYLVSGGIK